MPSIYCIFLFLILISYYILHCQVLYFLHYSPSSMDCKIYFIYLHTYNDHCNFFYLPKYWHLFWFHFPFSLSSDWLDFQKGLNQSIWVQFSSKFLNCCCCSGAKFCLALCDPIDCSMPDFPVLHYLPEFAQVHALCVGDTIESSHPLSSPSPLPSIFLSMSLFTMSWFWPSDIQSIGASSSASVLPIIFRIYFL